MGEVTSQLCAYSVQFSSERPNPGSHVPKSRTDSRNAATTSQLCAPFRYLSQLLHQRESCPPGNAIKLNASPTATQGGGHVGKLGFFLSVVLRLCDSTNIFTSRTIRVWTTALQRVEENLQTVLQKKEEGDRFRYGHLGFRRRAKMSM